MKKLLEQVVNYYLASPDFNGIPIYQIKDYNAEDMKSLISDGDVEAIYQTLNPHIKYFNKTRPVDEQIQHTDSTCQDVCFYPTPHALKSIKKIETKPYTKLLQSGWGQFEVRFFDVEVLEQYFNDPKYIIYDMGYRGSISLRDEYEDGDLIQDYGMAYPASFKTGGEIDRAVAVFIHDLARLSEKAQMKWKSREIEEQEAWFVNGSFTKNLIYGEWVNKAWIYDALLKEQVIINQYCDAIGIQHIFTKTWDADEWVRPEGYRTILFPTQKNYYEFVTVLEKMVCNNMPIEPFTQAQVYTKPVTHEEREGNLSVLGKWLKTNGRDPQVVDKTIVKPLKELRNIRQEPAHRFYSNQYDKSVYKKQNELIEKVFWGIHCLRIMLSSHPHVIAARIEVPEYLDNECRIVIY